MATPGKPNTFFVFGPSRSFVAYLPGVYSTSSNFAPEIANILAADNIKTVNFVAFPGSTGDTNIGTGGKITEACIGYHKKHGLKTAGLIYTPPNKSLALIGLEELIKTQDKKSEGVQVVCNGKGGLWAWINLSDKLAHFSHGLTIETRQWLKKLNPHGACPACVALGINDSYIVVYEDKHVVWDLKGCYEGFDKRLSQVLATSTTLSYAALNPYHEDQYFCIFDDWSCAFNFPDTDDFKGVEEMILESDLRVILDSETLRQSSEVVQVSETTTTGTKDGFAKTVMEKALTDMAEKNLENNLTGLWEVCN